MQRLFLSASIAANATSDVAQGEVWKSAPYDRMLKAVGISGATVNTGRIHVIVGQEDLATVVNGVSRATGTPIDMVSDLQALEDGAGILVPANTQITLNVDNTTGGALTYFIAIWIEEPEPE